jgi:hypothetical protein
MAVDRRAQKKGVAQEDLLKQHKEPFSAFSFIQDQPTLNFIRPLRNSGYDDRGNIIPGAFKNARREFGDDGGKERSSAKASVKKLHPAILAFIDRLEQLEDNAFEERQYWRNKTAGLGAQLKDAQDQLQDLEVINARAHERGRIFDESIEKSNSAETAFIEQLEQQKDENKHLTHEISRLEFEVQKKRREAKDAQLFMIKSLWHSGDTVTGDDDTDEDGEDAFHFLHSKQEHTEIVTPYTPKPVDDSHFFARRYEGHADGGVKEYAEMELRASPPLMMQTVGHHGSGHGSGGGSQANTRTRGEGAGGAAGPAGGVGKLDSVSRLSNADSLYRQSYSSGVAKPSQSRSRLIRPKSASVFR